MSDRGVRWKVVDGVLRVGEDVVCVKWRVAKECFGEWLWCGDFRDKVGWGLEEVYEGIGEVEKIEIVEGKVVMFESEGKVIGRK